MSAFEVKATGRQFAKAEAIHVGELHVGELMRKEHANREETEEDKHMHKLIYKYYIYFSRHQCHRFKFVYFKEKEFSHMTSLSR